VAGYPTGIGGVTMTSPQSSIMDNMGIVKTLTPLSTIILTLYNLLKNKTKTSAHGEALI